MIIALAVGFLWQFWASSKGAFVGVWEELGLWSSLSKTVSKKEPHAERKKREKTRF